MHDLSPESEDILGIECMKHLKNLNGERCPTYTTLKKNFASAIKNLDCG